MAGVIWEEELVGGSGTLGTRALEGYTESLPCHLPDKMDRRLRKQVFLSKLFSRGLVKYFSGQRPLLASQMA